MDRPALSVVEKKRSYCRAGISKKMSDSQPVCTGLGLEPVTP